MVTLLGCASPYTSGANANGFASEGELLMQTAKRVGDLHADDDRDGFLEYLTTLGMSQNEAETYWKKLSPASEVSRIRSNSDLVRSLGIELQNAHVPRNTLLYRLLELQYPDMLHMRVQGARHIGGAKGRRNPDAWRVIFDSPPLRSTGDPMKVYRVYEGERPRQFHAEVLRQAGPICTLIGQKRGMKLLQLLVDQKMLIPPESVLNLLARVLERAFQGKEVTLVGAFCPDYSYEETGNPGIPYRYTFDGVGSGIGLVAQQFARVIPPLSRFLTEEGIAHRIYLGIGDFEADSEDNLRRVGVRREEFIACCSASLRAFASRVPDLPLTLELFDTDRARGRLRPYAAEATERMLRGDFGKMPELYPTVEKVIRQIGIQYQAFYGRWYQKDLSIKEVMEIALRQGGEYAAVSRIFAEDFGETVITVAGDRPQMHLFNAFYTHLPVLCVKRAY